MNDKPTGKFGPDALVDKALAFGKENGLVNFVFMANDPDSDQYVMCRSGSKLWAIGACRSYETEMLNGISEESVEKDEP